MVILRVVLSVVLSLWLAAAPEASAQGALPPCPTEVGDTVVWKVDPVRGRRVPQPATLGDLVEKWDKCIGSYVLADGSKFTGEWRKGKPVLGTQGGTVAQSGAAASTVGAGTTQVLVGLADSAQVGADRLATERLNRERLERERQVAQQREDERLAAELREQKRLAAERLEREKRAAQQREDERLAAELREQERLAAERREREKRAFQQREDERLAAELREQQRLAAERLEREKRAAQQREDERLAAELREQQRLAAERREREKLAAQQRETERLAADLREQERLAAERREAEADRPLMPSAASAMSAGNKVVRSALVIGNGAYQSTPPLKNAVSDAKAIARTLRTIGYAVVERSNLSRSGMQRAVREWVRSLPGGSEAIFYFAGHGVQFSAANYLIPVDVVAEDEDQLKDDSLPLQRILDDLSEQRVRLSLIILDACRDNPFKSGVSGRSIGRSRGLAPTTAATGQIILYSAGAGQTALDELGPADRNPNGVFTRTLLKHMTTPNLPVDQVMQRTKREVIQLARSIGHEQVPALYDQTDNEYFLVER